MRLIANFFTDFEAIYNSKQTLATKLKTVLLPTTNTNDFTLQTQAKPSTQHQSQTQANSSV